MMNKKLLFLFPAILGMLLTSCNNSNDTSNSSSENNTTDSGGNTSDGGSDTSDSGDNTPDSGDGGSGGDSSDGDSGDGEQKLDFNDASFSDATFVFDGNPHILSEVSGIPENTTVTYTNRKEYVDVGSYQASAKLVKEGYNDKTLTATLTISPATFSGISFTDQEFEYDGKPHSIEIVGALPSTASVTYTSNVVGITNTATEIGEYTITATIKDKNYNDLVLTAKLTIKTVDDERYLMWSGDTLFFQNALHDNYFYAYNSNGNQLIKVGYDNAVDIVSTANNEVMYVSKSLFSSSIKSAKYDTSTSKTTQSIIYSGSARYVQYGSNSVVYYVVNGLTNDKSGIYKVDLSGQDPVSTCLSVGKAKYLTLKDNVLYFADGANGYKLSYIYTSSVNQTRTLLVDEKINNLYINNGSLFYTVNNLLGNYIEKFTLSTKIRRKLTSDAGIDFSFINDELYYINVDKLNTRIFGEGIYKVNASPLADNSQSGTKVIESAKGLCSLTTDGTYLYYYDMDGYKLNKASVSGSVLQNLLENFVKPDDPTPTSLGGDMGEYNGVLYYLDIWDDKTLHSYNPLTKVDVRLTSSKVDNFSIIGDEIYLNMVTTLVNNDTYRFNLKTGGTIEKVNTYDGSDFVSDGTYVYYAAANASGAQTAIRRMNMITLEEEQIYEKGVSNLRIVDGQLYFIDGYQIFSMNLQTLQTTEIKPNNKSVHTTVFDTDGTNIFYREMYGIAWGYKRLSKYNLKTGEYSVVVADKTDPITISYHNGFVYYYTDTTLGFNGLYRVDSSSSNATGTCLLETNNQYYATTFEFVSNSIYFTNYKTGGLFGDSHIYEMPLTGGTPTKID